MSIVYYVLAMLIVVITTTSLITRRLKMYQYLIQLLILTAVIYVSAEFGNGMGIPIVFIQVAMILLGQSFFSWD